MGIDSESHRDSSTLGDIYQDPSARETLVSRLGEDAASDVLAAADSIGREEVRRGIAGYEKTLADIATEQAEQSILQRQATRRFFTSEMSFRGRYLAEVGLIVGTAISTRFIDPNILVSGAYAVTQTGRALWGAKNKGVVDSEFNDKRPSGEIVTSASFKQTGETIFDQTNDGYAVKTAAKGFVVMCATVWMSFGSPLPAVEAGSEETPNSSSEDVVGTTIVPDESISDISPSSEESLSYECQTGIGVILTPMPFSASENLSEDTKEIYEANVRYVQSLLKHSGVYNAKIDGDPGPLTQEAIIKIKNYFASQAFKIEGLDLEYAGFTLRDCQILEEAGIWRRWAVAAGLAD